MQTLRLRVKWPNPLSFAQQTRRKHSISSWSSVPHTGPIQTVSSPVLLWNISNPSFMTTHDAVYRDRTQKSIVALICKQTALLIECWTGYVLFNYTYMISIFSVYDGACVFGLPNSPVVLTRSEFNYYWSDLRFPGTALNTSERR